MPQHSWGVLARAATASSGAEMVAALANPMVDLIRLTRPVVNVTPEDWQTSSVGLPIVLTRNVTIGGELNDWPQLNLIYVRGVNHAHLQQPSVSVVMTMLITYITIQGCMDSWFTANSYILCVLHGRGSVGRWPSPLKQPSSRLQNGLGCLQGALAHPFLAHQHIEGIMVDIVVSPLHLDISPAYKTAVSSYWIFLCCFFKILSISGGARRLALGAPVSVGPVTPLESRATTQGSDIFVPTDPGGPPGEVWLSTAAVYTPYCFPGAFHVLDVSLMPRPAQYPGNQTTLVDLPQDGCVDSHAAPPQTVNWARGSGGNSTSSLSTLQPVPNNRSASSRTAVVVGATVGGSAACALLLGFAAAVFLRRKGRTPTARPAATTADATAAAGGDDDRSLGAPAGTPLLELELERCRAQPGGRRPETTRTLADLSAYNAADNLPLDGASTLPGKRQPPTEVYETKAMIFTGVVPPVTTKTPRRPDIPLHVALVPLPQLPPGAAAAVGLGGGGYCLPQQPGLGAAAPAAAAAAAAAAACLQAIKEEPSTTASGVAPPEGADGGVCNADSSLQLQQATPESPSVGPGVMNAAVVLPEGFGGDSSSRSDLMTGSNTSSGEGCGVVCLMPVFRGKGTYGRVVEGLYAGRRVAVKLMANEELLGVEGAPPGTFIKTFAQEVEVLSRCQHPNIIQLLAACVSPPRLCLVMELMETSLDKLLYHSPGQQPMPLPKVLHIGICIANALAYLHPTITHRDLKPANVLIDNPQRDRPIVKLTDFGLARLRMTVKSTEHPDAGTECFDAMNRHITHQAVTYKGTRLPLESLISNHCPPKLVRLLEDCWDADPARRPAAAEAAKVLMLVMQRQRVQQSSPIQRANLDPSTVISTPHLSS
ncbi:hypothetical protein VOLCADRAFT_89421 [Volvox carteri f. nagariensis]|uniref:Protein kinase domain-containing protein n=1 Tax=Volvox carteri f. nagariensis TaxID=3068 RepID=D8TRN1_VOLCA|nr:uncharacterized protein VOLCADRAFT_89421 [Volvox carteri f. nagariensis]EFJ50019.1 hypothetical protein VOLCADRAFT_89421 [Volvox carteri f. nagariensis]|eukprot:XP_002949084.1 hypothetical protein VOLCADRAFT_89421 [Volvox carteri f. nagariensis]